MANSEAIITNQSFLEAYEKLNLARINVSSKSSSPSWEDILKVFTVIGIKINPPPTDQVS